jgi:hypothetical protein
VSALAAGFAMGAARLRRRPAWLAAALGLALAIASALVERRVTSVGAVDRALEATFGLVLPLAAFAAVSAVTSRERLRDAVWPLARYGGSARALALGACAAAAGAAAAFGALAAVLVVLVAHAPAAPPLVADAAVSAWLGALAGAAYVGWFSLGAAFGRRGVLRFAPLALDFTVGGTGGVLGAILPRGHVHALLGGAAPLGLPRLACTAALVGTAVVLTSLAAARTGD